MVRALVLGLVLFVTALLQVSVVPILTVSGFTPDLLLLVVIAFALQDGPATGVKIALPAGLLTDLLSTTTPVGLTVLVYLGIAYGVGVARPYVSPESLSAPIMFAAGGTFLGVGGYGLLAALLAQRSASARLIAEAALVATVYGALLAPVALAVARAVGRRFPLELTSSASSIP